MPLLPALDPLTRRALRPTTPAEVDALDDADGLAVSGRWPDECDWDGLTVEDCVLEHPAAQALTLRRARLGVVRLDRPELTSLVASGGHWRDVEVSGGRIASLELNGARLAQVALRGVRLGYVNLRDATLENVTVTDCVVDTLDLSGARVSAVSFSGSATRELETVRTRCAGVDLRGLEVRSITGVEGLKGCTVSHAQLLDLAPLLAESLGLTVS